VSLAMLPLVMLLRGPGKTPAEKDDFPD
jgi:hypothetical protein